MFKKTLFLSGLLAISISAFSQSDMHTTTRLGEPNAGGFNLYLVDETGEIGGLATVKPESWKGIEMTQYVARFRAGTEQIIYYSETNSFFVLQDDGQVISLVYFEESFQSLVQDSLGGRFVKGLRGKIEKFKRAGSDNEADVLVFRNSKGQFLTHKTLNVEAGWNRKTGDEEGWYYEIRYAKGNAKLSGQLINAVKLNTEDSNFVRYPGQKCPVLVVRDTADGENNGKFLTLIYGRVSNNQCNYFAPESPFLTGREGGSRMLTRRPLSK